MIKCKFIRPVSLISRDSVCSYKRYIITDVLNYSRWFNCSNYSNYTFFVQNNEKKEIKVFVQISPNKLAIVDEKIMYTIPPHTTIAMVPMNYSFFCRVAFKSILPNHTAHLDIWFQAQI